VWSSDVGTRPYARGVGRFIYAADERSTIDVDDELLVHLRIAIANKHRRGEGFMLTIPVFGTGYRAMWMGSSVPLGYHVFGARPVKIDPTLVNELIQAASEPDGLDLRTWMTERPNADADAA
jgi:hypothetical protein